MKAENANSEYLEISTELDDFRKALVRVKDIQSTLKLPGEDVTFSQLKQAVLQKEKTEEKKKTTDVEIPSPDRSEIVTLHPDSALLGSKEKTGTALVEQMRPEETGSKKTSNEENLSSPTDD